MLFFFEKIRILLPDHGKDIGTHQGRSHIDLQRFPLIAPEIGRKHTVDLPLLQGRKRLLCRRKGFGGKIHVRIRKAVGCILEIILQGTGQFSARRILCAECEIPILITYPDRTVSHKPGPFFR